MPEVSAAPAPRPASAACAQLPAVGVVADLAGRLGLPVSGVLTAAGVPERTFASWSVAGVAGPLLAGQPRLWALLQTVEDLEELVDGGLPCWLRNDPRRSALLRRGEFDAVLRDAEPPASADVGGAPLYAGAYGVGGDRAEDADVPVVTVRRRAVPSAPAARRRGAPS